jgi:hypothetical protein
MFTNLIGKIVDKKIDDKLEIKRLKEELLTESVYHFESLCDSEEQLKFVFNYLVEKGLKDDFLTYAEESKLYHEDFLYFDELMSEI